MTGCGCISDQRERGERSFSFRELRLDEIARCVLTQIDHSARVAKRTERVSHVDRYERDVLHHPHLEKVFSNFGEQSERVRRPSLQEENAAKMPSGLCDR